MKRINKAKRYLQKVKNASRNLKELNDRVVKFGMEENDYVMAKTIRNHRIEMASDINTYGFMYRIESEMIKKYGEN